MKRSLLIMIFIFTLLCSCSLAEDKQSIYIEKLGITVSMPLDYIVLTPDNYDNETVTQHFGLSAEALKIGMTSMNSYVTAFSDDFSREISICIINSEMENLNFGLDAIEDSIVGPFIDSVESAYDSMGCVSDGNELYKYNNCRTILYRSHRKDGSVHSMQYFTIQNYKQISLNMNSYDGGFDTLDELRMKIIIGEILTGLDDLVGLRSLAGQEEEFNIMNEDYEYRINSDETITIMKYDGVQYEESIPSSLDNKTVTGLAYNSFQYANNLSTVTIPKDICQTYGNPFAGCRKLERIEVSPENESLIMQDGILYSKDMKSAVSAPRRDTNHISFTLPEGVETIDPGAFAGFMAFELELPASLTKIGQSAFCDSTLMKTVIIPPNVKEIGKNAFSQCTILPGCFLPEGITIIDDYTFYSCYGLKDINIPVTVSKLGKGCFQGSGIINIEIPESVSAIPQDAFANCRNLETITIPANVTSIDDTAFMDCPDTLELIVEEGSYALSYAQKKNLKYKASLIKDKTNDAAGNSDINHKNSSHAKVYNEIDSTYTHSVAESSLKIRLPNDWYYLDKDISEDNPFTAFLGKTKTQIYDDFFTDTKLILFTCDKNIEIMISIYADESPDTDFVYLNENGITNKGEKFSKWLSEQGSEVVRTSIIQNKYPFYKITTKDDDYPYTYYIITGGYEYIIETRTRNSPDEAERIIDNIILNISF